MSPTIIDPTLYCNFEVDELLGLKGSYIDDLLRAGADEWQAQANATLERFETTRNEQLPFTFAGIHITDNESMVHIDQDIYMRKIE